MCLEPVARSWATREKMLRVRCGILFTVSPSLSLTIFNVAKTANLDYFRTHLLLQSCTTPECVFRTTHICSYFLGVHETSRRVSQQLRIRNTVRIRKKSGNCLFDGWSIILFDLCRPNGNWTLNLIQIPRRERRSRLCVQQHSIACNVSFGWRPWKSRKAVYDAVQKKKSSVLETNMCVDGTSLFFKDVGVPGRKRKHRKQSRSLVGLWRLCSFSRVSCFSGVSVGRDSRPNWNEMGWWDDALSAKPPGERSSMRQWPSNMLHFSTLLSSQHVNIKHPHWRQWQRRKKSHAHDSNAVCVLAGVSFMNWWIIGKMVRKGNGKWN